MGHGPATGRLVAGIDLGGTKVLGYALDLDRPGVRLAVARTPTPRGGAAIADAISTVVDELERSVGERSLAAIGVGAAGLIDREGVVRFAPNLPTVVEFELAAPLRARHGAPVVVANDATCAAVAEHRVGVARAARNAVLVTLGTGIGGGVIVDGRVVLGTEGFAGEPGHMVVDPHGPPCPCGRRGCWERMASGRGLARLAREAADAGLADSVVALAGGDAAAVRGEHVTTAARAGDPDAIEVLRRFAWWVALGIGNLVNVLDCELAVVGGGLVDAADVLLPLVREAFHGLVLAADHRPPVRIEAARLGHEAGAVGAALLAGDLLV